MARLAVLLACLVALPLVPGGPATAIVLHSDRAQWEAAVGSWLPVDAGQISLDGGNSALALPWGGTLTWTGPGYPPGVVAELWGIQVPSGNFPAWGPSSPSRVLWAPWDDPDLIGMFSHQVTGFGLELRPGGANPDPRWLVLDLGPLGTLAQQVGAEARFFGWTGGSVTSLELYTQGPLGGQGFAIGAMVVGDEALVPQQAVPEPGTLVLLASGLAVLAGRLAQRARRTAPGA